MVMSKKAKKLQMSGFKPGFSDARGVTTVPEPQNLVLSRNSTANMLENHYNFSFY